MTTTISEAIGKFAGEHRPLRNFTKEQLFLYPKADPSQEAGFKFTREVIHRREACDRVKRSVMLAKDRLEEAHAKMVRNASEAKAPYEKQVAMRKRELASAQAELDSLPANEGALSHEEVQAHYREKHLPEYEAMIAKWKTLDLFQAQQFGWGSFLAASAEIRSEDKQNFKALQTLAALCSEDRSPTYLEINAMNAYRIAPSGGWRKQFLTEDGDLRTPAALDKELQRVYWEAWRNYNTATFNFKWPDDGGVAYNSNLFSINKPEED